MRLWDSTELPGPCTHGCLRAYIAPLLALNPHPLPHAHTHAADTAMRPPLSSLLCGCEICVVTGSVLRKGPIAWFRSAFAISKSEQMALRFHSARGHTDYGPVLLPQHLANVISHSKLSPLRQSDSCSCLLRSLSLKLYLVVSSQVSEPPEVWDRVYMSPTVLSTWQVHVC